MCHLCRKLTEPQTVDSKAKKPLVVALSKLHQRVEPHFGDLWQARLNSTLKLRDLFCKLHRAIPVKKMKAILDELNNEIAHITENMADHPTRRRGKAFGEKLMESVTASESASVEVMRQAELGREGRESGRKERKACGESSGSGDGVEKKSLEQPSPDLPGSDLNPPSVRVWQSIRTVEKWIMRNNAETVVYTRNKRDESLVSVIGHGLKERPAVDVGIWKKTGGLQSWRGRSSTDSSATSPHSYTIPGQGVGEASDSGCCVANQRDVDERRSDQGGLKGETQHDTQISNCVYEKPPQNIHFNLRIFTQIANLALRKDQKHQFYRILNSNLQRNKAEKLSTRRKISTFEAVHLLQARQRRRKRKDLISGGLSNGSSPRGLLETVANSSQGRTSFESSIPNSISLTASDVERCVTKAGAETKYTQYSSTESSSDFSNRTPALSLGSFLQQSPLSPRNSLSEHQNHRRQVSTPSSLDSSRLSAINFGSFLNELLQSDKERIHEAQKSKQECSREVNPMNTSSNKPTVPEPIGRPVSPPIAKSPRQLQREDRRISTIPFGRAEQAGMQKGGSGPRAEKENRPPKSQNYECSNNDLPTKSPYVKYFRSQTYDTSDATQNSRRRRAERRVSVVNDKPIAGSAVEEKKVLPKSAYDIRPAANSKLLASRMVERLAYCNSTLGGMTQERKGSWQPKLADQPQSQIFAGSLDPDYVRSRESSRAAENPSRRRTEGRISVTTETLVNGMRQEGKEPSPPGSSDRWRGHPRGKIDPEYIEASDSGVSDAVKNSRRRRAERSSSSVPFNDRHRNEERKKAWSSAKPQ